MRRLGKFVTKEELATVRTERDFSGMCFSGGQPVGDPFAAVRRLTRQYGLPDTAGLDLKNGEFVDSTEKTTNAND